MAQKENNIADAIGQLATEISYAENPAKARSDFSGHSIADSMGFIADALLRIADALEKQNKEEG